MSWPGRCNVTLQDCAELYPMITPRLPAGSCVHDANRGPLYGTCGWVGSKCSSTGAGISNCQDDRELGYPNLCYNGQCEGGVGSACENNDQCLGSVFCNGTTCGGDGAFFNSTVDDPPVPRAYCISGLVFVDPSSTTYCGAQPTATSSTHTVSPSSPATATGAVQSPPSNTPSSSSNSRKCPSIGPILGSLLGVRVILALLNASS